MKSVFLIRHAKSSWDNILQKDFERPLNDRGKRDAPIMAKRLLDKKIKIDAFISSPAKRALTTCKYFAKAYARKEEEIIQIPFLYEAAATIFYDVIKNAHDKFNSVAIFAHNPGITEFVNSLTHVTIDNMPTCSVFAVYAEIKIWKSFAEAEKKFLFFDYPKLKK